MGVEIGKRDISSALGGGSGEKGVGDVTRREPGSYLRWRVRRERRRKQESWTPLSSLLILWCVVNLDILS